MSEKQATTPMVSVWMITYNHEPYISQAIESILEQKTNFEFELVIGEDHSTDKTAEIIKHFELKHPQIIKARYNSQNIGMIPNMIKTLEECNGKYIALCEGDDFWTDPFKLQKQVDFLETHLDYTGVAHQATVKHEHSNAEESLFRNHDIADIELRNVIGDRLFHTASFMFRSDIVKTHALPSNITAGDRALFILVASIGKIKYTAEPMCCYRKNNSGISTWVTSELMEKDLNIVPWIKKINQHFPKHEYYQFIHYTILRFPKHLTKLKAIKHSFWFLFHSFREFPKNIKKIILFLIYEFPLIWKKTKVTND